MSTGQIGDNKPNAAKEVKTSSGWVPGKGPRPKNLRIQLLTNNGRPTINGFY